MNLDNRFLAQCETEALHLSGAIQPHGSLLVLGATGRISHAAANIEAYLGCSPGACLGGEPPSAFRPLLTSLGIAPGGRRSALVVTGPAGETMEAVATRGEKDIVILELTRHVPPNPAHQPRLLQRTAVMPENDAALGAAEFALTESIADLTRFQRVMYYRFREDGDGEVIAEARRDDVYGSYLGLRYPASDIPQIARSLYLKNPWRLIPDATAASVPILGQTEAAPDLSYSDLRSVSPVHQAYLANMGVRASLSFPVVQRGELVALIAAHHTEPLALPLRLLEEGASIVHSHAVMLLSYNAQRRMKIIDELAHRYQRLRPLLEGPDGLLENWPELSAWLMEEFSADGACLRLGASCRTAGRCADPATVAVLERWLGSTSTGFVAQVDNLARQGGAQTGPAVAGAMAFKVRVPGLGELHLYVTRQEHVHEVAWGGNPDKPVEYTEDKLAVSPRHSFEKWVEKRTGYCRPWSSIDHLRGLSLRNFLQGQLGP